MSTPNPKAFPLANAQLTNQVGFAPRFRRQVTDGRSSIWSSRLRTTSSSRRGEWSFVLSGEASGREGWNMRGWNMRGKASLLQRTNTRATSLLRSERQILRSRALGCSASPATTAAQATCWGVRGADVEEEEPAREPTQTHPTPPRNH